MYHPSWKACAACWLCLILLCPSIVRAQIPSPLPDTYVNDLARVLTPEDLQALNEQINALEKTWSVQLAVVLIRRLPDSMDIADYARGIGRKWHASINDSGLVYVASINQKKQRLEVATSLEGIIPDITARTITDHLKPFFRKKDYAAGLKQMVSEINGYLEQARTGQEPVDQPPAQQAPANDPAPFQNVDNNDQGISWPFLVFGPFALGVFFIILYNIFSGGRRRSEYYSSTGTYIDNNVYIAGSNYGQPYNRSDNNIVDAGSSGSSDYGNWGGGSDSGSSSDPGFSSSDSGFSGGGSSNDW
jgi:uncharacterized protein